MPCARQKTGMLLPAQRRAPGRRTFPKALLRLSWQMNLIHIPESRSSRRSVRLQSRFRKSRRRIRRTTPAVRPGILPAREVKKTPEIQKTRPAGQPEEMVRQGRQPEERIRPAEKPKRMIRMERRPGMTARPVERPKKMIRPGKRPEKTARPARQRETPKKMSLKL